MLFSKLYNTMVNKVCFVGFMGAIAPIGPTWIRHCQIISSFLILWKKTAVFRAAMSSRSCLLGQKLCHYLNHGRILNDILMRAAHRMTYFDPSKLKLV